MRGNNPKRAKSWNENHCDHAAWQIQNMRISLPVAKTLHFRVAEYARRETYREASKDHLWGRGRSSWAGKSWSGEFGKSAAMPGLRLHRYLTAAVFILRKCESIFNRNCRYLWNGNMKFWNGGKDFHLSAELLSSIQKGAVAWAAILETYNNCKMRDYGEAQRYLIHRNMMKPPAKPVLDESGRMILVRTIWRYEPRSKFTSFDMECTWTERSVS